MELSGKERKILREEILSTYPDEEELKLCLSEEMDIDFDAIAKGENYSTRIFNLIRDQEAKETLLELLEGLVGARPKSSKFKELIAQLRSPLTPKRTRIFISYKREVQPDEQVALQLEKALGERNDVAIDRNMRIGTHWLTWIDEQIQRADFLVVLLSSESVLSEMVQLEIEKARQHYQKQGNPQILPVRLAYRQPFQYPLSEYLNPLNWALWQSDADTPTLIAEIEKALRGDEMSLNNETQKAAVVQSHPQADLRPPQPMAQLYKLELPEGTMDLESKFYIERREDGLAMETIQQQGVTITIKGPRQMGKSSLLNRVMRAAREMGKQVVYLDFQLFESDILHDGDRFFQGFCSWLSEELNQEDRVADYWNNKLGNSQRCTRYVGRHVLGSLDTPLVLAMDEVETMFDTPFRSDFFSMLRSWHNNRAMQPLWKKLDLALVTSTEPYQLIADLNQSPFNVGQVLDLSDFTLEQLQDLNYRHGKPLNAQQERQLMELVNGQPYLTRRALYLVASGQRSLSDLFAQATEDRGPFGDHLRYHLFRVYDRPELVEGLKQALWQPTVLDEGIFFRLRGAGLLRKQGQNAVPRCQLYEAYFREHLGK